MGKLTNKTTILLVEDETISAMHTKMQLEQQGFYVYHAHSGEDAVRCVFEMCVIDLIVMDIELGPGMNGLQTAAHILNRIRIPIIFLSSHTEPEIISESQKIVSCGYIIKNSGTEILTKSILAALSGTDNDCS